MANVVPEVPRTLRIARKAGHREAIHKRGSRKPRLAQHSTAPRFLQADFRPGIISALPSISQ